MGDRRHFNRNLDQDGPLFPRSNLEQNLDQYFSSNRQQQQSNAFSDPPMNGFNNRPGNRYDDTMIPTARPSRTTKRDDVNVPSFFEQGSSQSTRRRDMDSREFGDGNYYRNQKDYDDDLHRRQDERQLFGRSEEFNRSSGNEQQNFRSREEFHANIRNKQPNFERRQEVNRNSHNKSQDFKRNEPVNMNFGDESPSFGRREENNGNSRSNREEFKPNFRNEQQHFERRKEFNSNFRNDKQSFGKMNEFNLNSLDESQVFRSREEFNPHSRNESQDFRRREDFNVNSRGNRDFNGRDNINARRSQDNATDFTRRAGNNRHDSSRDFGEMNNEMQFSNRDNAIDGDGYQRNDRYNDEFPRMPMDNQRMDTVTRYDVFNERNRERSRSRNDREMKNTNLFARRESKMSNTQDGPRNYNEFQRGDFGNSTNFRNDQELGNYDYRNRQNEAPFSNNYNREFGNNSSLGNNPAFADTRNNLNPSFNDNFGQFPRDDFPDIRGDYFNQQPPPTFDETPGGFGNNQQHGFNTFPQFGGNDGGFNNNRNFGNTQGFPSGNNSANFPTNFNNNGNGMGPRNWSHAHDNRNHSNQERNSRPLNKKRNRSRNKSKGGREFSPGNKNPKWTDNRSNNTPPPQANPTDQANDKRNRKGKKKKDANFIRRRRQANILKDEAKRLAEAGILKKPPKHLSKCEPEKYWTDWWPKYAYIEKAAQKVDPNDEAVKEFIEFTYEPTSVKFENRKKLLLRIGCAKIQKNLNINEINYHLRDVYKLFVYRKHLQDPNFQKYLNDEEKRPVKMALDNLRNKAKWALLLQSLIHKWHATSEQQHEATRNRNAIKLQNDKLFHYLVLEAIDDLKTLCANEWPGFEDFHQTLMTSLEGKTYPSNPVLSENKEDHEDAEEGPFRNNVQMPGGGGSDNPNSSFGINNNRDNNTHYKQQTFVSGKGEHWNYFGSENNNSNDNYPRKNNNNVFERLDTAKSMNSNMIERNNFDDDFRRDEEDYGNNSNWRNFNSNVNNNLGRNIDNAPQNWNSNNDLRNNSKVGRGGDDGWRKNNRNFGMDNSKCGINNVPFGRDFNDGGSDINNTNNRQNFGPGNVDELRNNSKGEDGWRNDNRNFRADPSKWGNNMPFEREFNNGSRGINNPNNRQSFGPGNVNDLRNNSKGGNGWINNNRNVGPDSSKWGNNNRPFEKEFNSGGRDIYSSNNNPNFDPAARDAENFNRWKNNTNFGPNNPKDFKKDNNNFEGGNNNWNTFGPRNSIDFQTFKNFGNVANTNSWDCERGSNRPFPNDIESQPPRNAKNTFSSNNFAVDNTRNLENPNNMTNKSFSINNMNFDDRRFNGPDDIFTPDNNTSWNKTPDNYNRRSNEETFATNIPVRSNNNFEINSRNDDFRVDPRQLEDQRFGRNEPMFSPRKQMLDEVRKRHLDNPYGNPNAMSHNKSHNMQRNYPVASGRQNNANDLDEEELLRKRRRRNSNDDDFQSNHQKAKFPAKRDASYDRHSHKAQNSFQFEHHENMSDHHDYDDNDDAYNYGDDINDCGSEATVYTGQLILKPYPAGPTKRNPKAYWKNWWPKYVYIENSIEQVDKNDEYVKHKLKFQPLTDDDIHKEAGDFINAAMKYFSTATRRLTEQNFRNRDLRTILKMRGTVYNILFNVALTKKEQARCHFLLLLMNHKVKLAFIYQDIIEFWHRCKETVRRFENAEISLSDEVTQAYVVLNDRLYIHFLYESIIQLKVICVSEYPSFLKFYKGLQMKLAKTKTTTT